MNEKLNRIAANIFNRLPSRLNSLVLKRINEQRLYKAGLLKTPTSLVLFITNNCNLKCKHCFYWKNIAKKEQMMSVADIRRIAASLRDCYSVVITGGEPFLRNDIYQVCRAFNNKIRTLRIATNGMEGQFIVKTVTRLLKNCNFRHIDIQISIDGPEKIHDKIRGVPGSYKRAINTIMLLAGLKEKRMSVEVVTTINKINYNSISKLIDQLIPLEIPISFIITRSSNYGVFCLPKQVSSEISTREKLIENLDSNSIKSLCSILKNKNKKSHYKFWPMGNQLYLKTAVEILDKKRKMMKCYAGIVDGTIYPNGDVSLCELTKPIGNLKDYDYNFYKLWSSEKANDMRGKISKCFCIHGCNLSTSISMSEEYLSEVILGNKKG